MIDNSELNRILEMLESLKDEKLAADYLKKITKRSSELGQLLLNKDPNLDHIVWKKECDAKKREVDDLINEIKEVSSAESKK